MRGLLLAGLLILVSGCATLLVTGGLEPEDPSAGVAGQVAAALRADAGIDASSITVSAQGSVVTLEGVVPSRAQVERAARRALAVAGVSRIINRLSVPAGD